MHVLVTGGAGFIGSHLLDRLLIDGHTVTSVDDLSGGDPKNVVHIANAPEIRLLQLDLARDELAVAFQPRPDLVVHLAAQVSVRKSIVDPVRDAEINVLGTVRLLEAARSHHVGKVVFSSSGGCIYGQPDLADLPVAESHSTKPYSPYGASKLAGEQYLATFARLYGFRWTSLALANVYGPRQDPAGEAGVVATFVERMLADEVCTVFGTGEQTRDFVHVNDVVDSLLLASDGGDGTRINIGTGTRTSINDLFTILSRIIGYEREPERRASRIGELDHVSLDPRLAEEALGWSPSVELAHGLAGTVEWARHALPGGEPATIERSDPPWVK